MATDDKNLLTDSTCDKDHWSMLVTSYSKQNDDVNAINDSKIPEFRLNEPGPTGLATSVFQKNNPNSDVLNSDFEASFVVLGPSSMDLTKGVDPVNIDQENTEVVRKEDISQIHSQANFLDHSAMFLSMSPSEAEEKLNQLIEENLELKQSLNKNNEDMKKQVDKITLWQKEVLEVCQTQKQKFEETKLLLSQLKMENDILRNEVSLKNLEDVTKSGTQTSINSQESIFNTLNSTMDEKNLKDSSSSDQSTIETSFIKKIEALSMNLQSSKTTYLNSQKELEQIKRIENRYVKDVDTYNQQLQKIADELESLKTALEKKEKSLSKVTCKRCEEYELEIELFKKTMSAFHQEIELFKSQPLMTIDLEKNESQESIEKSQLWKNIDLYNSQVIELNKRFAAHCSNILKCQEILRDCIDSLKNFEELQNSGTSDNIKILQVKFMEYRQKFLNQTLQSIDNKQSIIDTQKQFQKILSDYNSIVCEMQIVDDENLKIKTLRDQTLRECHEKTSEIEKLQEENRIKIEEERTEILEEKIRLSQEKKYINEMKQKVDVENNYLEEEKKKLEDERKSLQQEGISLDLQSKLYEAVENSLQKEKKDFQKKYDDLVLQNNHLQEDLLRANRTIAELRLSNTEMQEKVKIIAAYQIQTDLRERDYQDLILEKERMQKQIDELSLANAELRDENYRLRENP